MLTADQIRALLVDMLDGVRGGGPDHWRDRVGEIVVFSPATHPSSNWRATPNGLPREVAAVDMAVELVRQEHPHARR